MSAYIWGEKGGLLPEHPFPMGEALNGTPGLDIDAEIMLANEEVKRLRSERASEAAITNALKDFGLKRFVIVFMCFFFVKTTKYIALLIETARYITFFKRIFLIN